jgi:ribonuclease G
VRLINLVQFIVNYASSEKRYVLKENNRVSKLYIEQPVGQSLVGNIYLGIVTKVLPGMNAVFVDIGEKKQGFLHREKLPSHALADKHLTTLVHQGEKILVQVEKDGAGTKGPRLTALLEFQGEHLIYMPQGSFVATSQKIENSKVRDELKAFGETLIYPDEGLIFRTSSANVSSDALTAELADLREQYKQLLKESQAVKGPQLIEAKDLFFSQLVNDIRKVDEGEIWVDDLSLRKKLENLNQRVSVHFHQAKENIFSALNVEQEIEKALKRIVWLENGSYMVIDETEALTIIDVNTGKFVGKSSKDLTALQVNIEAATEVARQMMLRDLGGMVLIDFIDMKHERDRQEIISVLNHEFKKDDKKPRIIGFTELGILQITRRKTKPTLSETVQVKCQTCQGTGKVQSPESLAFKLERELYEYRQSDYHTAYVTTSEDVYHLFSGENSQYQQKLETITGLKVHFTLAPSNKPYYEITKLDSL